MRGHKAEDAAVGVAEMPLLGAGIALPDDPLPGYRDPFAVMLGEPLIVPELRQNRGAVAVAATGGVRSGLLPILIVRGVILVVVVGHDTPMIPKGRMIKNTVACYSGEQGYYMCKTVLTLDAGRQVTSGEADAVMLGSEVGDQPEIYKLVKSFEDGIKEKLLKAEAERAARAAKQGGVNQ